MSHSLLNLTTQERTELSPHARVNIQVTPETKYQVIDDATTPTSGNLTSVL